MTLSYTDVNVHSANFFFFFFFFFWEILTYHITERWRCFTCVLGDEKNVETFENIVITFIIEFTFDYENGNGDGSRPIT